MLSRFSGSRKVGKLSFLIAIVSITGLAFSNTQTFASSAFKSAADPYSGKLVYWFWAESDVPGSTAWMQAAIKRYEALHKNISIELVPQGSDTLQGAFETTAQSKSGPDIAMQWATLPVLTPVWRGQVASLKGLVKPSEMANWLNTSENVSGGEVWAKKRAALSSGSVEN